jgi:flavin-dependent dehydrogenase
MSGMHMLCIVKSCVYDVAIVGAGLADLQLARLLARGGASVLLVDARRRVTDGVRTTGIFVRRTFEDFPWLDQFLGPVIRTIGLHSPGGRSIALESGHDEAFVRHVFFGRGSFPDAEPSPVRAHDPSGP